MVHRAKKRAFIAGSTVAGDSPDNWQHAAEVGINATLTDYSLRLSPLLEESAMLIQNSAGGDREYAELLIVSELGGMLEHVIDDECSEAVH